MLKDKLFISEIANNKIDYSAQSDIHPVINQYYTVHHTSLDHNCLYNMISICLIGNESISKVIRGLTIFGLLTLKSQIIEIISNDPSYNQNKATIMNKYKQLLYDTKTNKVWGGAYQLIVLSTVLSRDIIICGSFKNENNDWNNPNVTTATEMLEIFQRKNRTGSHLIYKPIKNNIFSPSSSNMLYGF